VGEQIHGQTVHLLQILPGGRFVKVHHFGKLCWDDDELVLSEQAHAEERWRASHVCPSWLSDSAIAPQHAAATLVI
jgi:hypothetical protein